MRMRPSVLAVFGLAALVAAAACLPGSGPPLNPYFDDAGPAPPTKLGGDDASVRLDVNLGPSFAVTGLQPSHGPWTGGTRTTVAGQGFSSYLQVWIGSTELAPSDVFASDRTRAAVVTPPGSPGPTDVRVRNVGSTDDAVLPGGFTYDAISLTPTSGATTGGTRIALHGMGTHWTSASTVAVGGATCAGVTFVDDTHLSCSTPPHGPGSQSVTVTNADHSTDEALDAYLYSDSPDGYRGGLYGGALAGNLKVLAFDGAAGTPLAGAKAIVGSNLAGAVIGTLDASGTAQLSAPSLTGSVTVTVAAKCHQPMTFVDVPTDTVTAYLEPELDPSCLGDALPPGPIVPVLPGEIDGELVWEGGIEFQKAAWKNVPQPATATERQVAYVWVATTNPLDTLGFDPSTATTPDSSGQLGYGYTLTALPGNATVYALAGIEDRAVLPPRFEPYAMGVARGVPIVPGGKTVGVDIPMTTTLDRALTTAPKPPPTGLRGPDRFQTTVAIDVGAGAFALLPQGKSTSLLPLPGTVSFVGVPSLDGTLSSASYNLTGWAATGSSMQLPQSVLQGIETTDANDPIALDGFLPVPTLTQPGSGTWSGTHVELQASGPIDLIYVVISSANGLVKWSIVAPGFEHSFDLPDISQIAGVGKLLHGPITTSFIVARLPQFDYGTLRQGQLYSPAWSAYAQDAQPGVY
jgi:hypothetical protein